MPKLIIRHPEDVTDEEALTYVLAVVRGGRISKGGHGDQYCWHTAFKDNFHVEVLAKHNLDAADSFVVWRGE